MQSLEAESWQKFVTATRPPNSPCEKSFSDWAFAIAFIARRWQESLTLFFLNTEPLFSSMDVFGIGMAVAYTCQRQTLRIGSPS
jgi:hypothetical protein